MPHYPIDSGQGAAFDSRSPDPDRDTFVRDWTRGKRVVPITLSATDHGLAVR